MGEKELPPPPVPEKVPPPELPVNVGLAATAGVGDAAGAAPAPVLPLLPATNAGEAVELTCTVARSRVSCWSLGSATGSCEVSEAGRSEANLFAASSRVLRSMVILRPSRVRLAEGPLTVSVALVTAMEMPSSFSSLLMDAIGSESGAFWPAAEIPSASTVTCWPAMAMFCTRVVPVTLPVVPSEVALAVDVMLPMEMKPPRMEMPPTVALATALALVLGACDDEVADSAPTPMMVEEEARGLPGPEGAVWAGLAPLAPAVEAPLPSVALAVFPLALLAASMDTPG